MSPEALMHKIYSIKTDAWAYGITLIEIFTREVPYKGMDMLFVAPRVARGELFPSIPNNIPSTISSIMQSCFETDPANRPTFEYICKYFQDEERQ